MAEKHQDLGHFPENQQERQPHVCPACEREFKEIKDYPKVYIASVDIVTPEEVPAEIPHWQNEILSLSPSDLRNAQVPEEVLAYFRDNPDVETMVFSDSYIYERPYSETQRHREFIEKNPEYANANFVNGDEYRRKFNFASMMKLLLKHNGSLSDYLESLRQMTGQEIPTKEVYPKWQVSFFPSLFRVPSGFAFPNTEKFFLSFREIDNRPTEYRVAEIGVCGEGPNLGSAGGPTISLIMPIGSLNYEGRVNHV